MLSILGIVLLSLILLTWIFPQLPQVGIMKALGASTQSIVGAYLIVLVIILLLGLSMGIPLGYLSAKGYNRFIAMIQNFTVVDSLLPIGNHLVVIIVCLAVPLLFSVSILTRIGRTSVNNAISQTFRSSANYWFTLTQRLIPASKHKYAVNNLWRNYQRSLLMILLLSIGIALFFTGRNLEHSIKTDFKNNLAYLDYGVLVSLGGLQTKNMDFLDSLPYINKQASVLVEMVQYESLHKGYDESTLLLNFPSDYQFKKELLLEGTLQPDCMNCFYVNQRLLDDFKNVALGKQVKFTRKDGSTTFYKYAGIIKDLAGSGMYRFSNEFMTSYNLQAIDIPSDSLRDETLDQIEKQIKAHGMDVSRISTSREMMAGLENHLAPTYKVVQYMGIFTATVALLGLLMVLSLSIQERISEIGILKSMGCNGSKNSKPIPFRIFNPKSNCHYHRHDPDFPCYPSALCCLWKRVIGYWLHPCI